MVYITSTLTKTVNSLYKNLAPQQQSTQTAFSQGDLLGEHLLTKPGNTALYASLSRVFRIFVKMPNTQDLKLYKARQG